MRYGPFGYGHVYVPMWLDWVYSTCGWLAFLLGMVKKGFNMKSLKLS